MKKTNNKLYWKISLTLLSLLVILGIVYVSIFNYIRHEYFHESVQRLHYDLAENALKEVKPYKNGEVQKPAIMDFMHSAMVMNPNAELYLLDTKGKIITDAAPKGKVVMESVALAPIKKFVASKGKEYLYIEGDDPRDPKRCKVFSAAEVREEEGGDLKGYIYIILASEKQEAVESGLFGSYMLKLGANLFFITLIGALLIGLLAIWLLTRGLRNITQTVSRFKEGDYKARIADTDKVDFPEMSETFNEMADTIVANIDELKSVENLRRELIANVSHDLRTPLAIVQGYVETLLMKGENISEADRKKYLETSMSGLERLSKLIAQLFEYSKLEAKQIEPEKEPFFIGELAQDVAHKYQILAEQKSIKIDLDVAPNLPLVFADLSLVERVIQNLMDNALNYTPENGAIILAVSEVNNKVQIRIKDNGPGISEKDQAFIFDRYRQASRTGESKKGAGLGLAIVKKILDLHDSTIEVKSKLNEGTAFMFQLPAYSQ